MSRLFPDSPPDLLLVDANLSKNPFGFRLHGLADVGVPTAFVFSDWWGIDERHHDSFAEMVMKNRVQTVLSLFPQPQQRWAGSSIEQRIVWLPACFDPAIFNDWRMPKRYDVGFLADGTASPNIPFYPERFEIHQLLLARRDLRYLWSAHPGWCRHSNRHPLVGRNFSRAINSCRIFVTTGGIHRNPQPKIFETMASHSLLMSDEPVGAAALGLVDGDNYVQINPGNVMEKIDHYLSRPELCERIAEQGYQLAMARHSCYTRALELRRVVRREVVNCPLTATTIRAT